MKIALGGSAANPAHYGHKALTEAVLRLNQFDRVRWIVSGDRPDKQGMPAPFHRWQMTKRLGIDPSVEVTFENGLAIPTIDVIRQAQEEFPQAQIVWYGGSDHFVSRSQFDGLCDVEAFWDEGEWLMEKQSFLIVERHGTQNAPMRYPKKFTLLNGRLPEISSTLIRQNVCARRDNSALTSLAVIDYINQHQLYSCEKEKKL